MDTKSEDFLDELKKKHGVVHQLTAPGGESVVVKMPTRDIWKRYTREIADEKRRPDAGERLLRAVMVHPELTAFDAMLEMKPGLAEAFGVAVVELAGLTGNVEKKSL